MKIDFDEKNHCYAVDGDIASISVTELLKKHGLSPYSNGFQSGLMSQKAEVGKEVHKDLENVINTAKYAPQTEQGKNFKKWVDENLDCGVAEQRIAYDYNGLLIAGTADLVGFLKNGKLLIADHKNTESFNREYVSWQVSILDYFFRALKDELVNGNIWNWKGAETFYCFHYKPDNGELTVKELTKVPDNEIERLLQCEFDGEIYKRTALAVDDDLKNQIEIAEAKFATLSEQYKTAEAEIKDLRQKLCEEFERQGLISFETPNGYRFTYVPKSESITTDTPKLKELFPNAFSQCQKITHRKAYVRVTTPNGE